MKATHRTVLPKSRVNSSQRARAWTGPPILTYGYRPFFLMAGIWAMLAMLIWLAELSGWSILRTRFDPVDWHAHEMLFGYLGAVMAGYLLSTFPNWTGRLPILGWPLLGLGLVWGLGRVAIAFSSFLPPGLAAVVDLAFPALLVTVLCREVIVGKGWRNLPLLALLTVFATANVLFHFNTTGAGLAVDAVGFRLGLAVAIMMITLIGGRIVPSFTRNWLVRRGMNHRPAPHGLPDQVAVGAVMAGLIGWVLFPDAKVSAALWLVAGLANLVRMARWQTWHTRAAPLVWILHVGYFCVPAGFLVLGASALGLGFGLETGGQHIWMAGAIGIMTLAVMSRVGLGHDRLSLRATRGLTMVYLFVITAVVLRIIAGLGPTLGWALHLSALCWVSGFLGFVILYGPIFNRRVS